MTSCAICFNLATGKCAVLPRCGHVYCASCISKWFDKSEGTTTGEAACPRCKTGFDLESLLPVFLDVSDEVSEAFVLGTYKQLANNCKRLATINNTLEKENQDLRRRNHYFKLDLEEATAALEENEKEKERLQAKERKDERKKRRKKESERKTRPPRVLDLSSIPGKRELPHCD